MLTTPTLLTADFETDPLASGWHAPNGEITPAMRWSAEDACTGTHSLALDTTDGAHGFWESPRFPVADRQYFRITFATKAQSLAMWALYFYDADGQLISGDHYSSFDASEAWVEQTYCAKTKFPGVTASFVLYAMPGNIVHLDALRVTAIERATAEAWAHATTDAMPPMPYVPPADAGARLPRTLARLRAGGPFRIVMLGDSIANDTSNSPYDLFLERVFPGAEIEVRFTGKGGTGWRVYQDEVAARVLAHQPDLVIFLAISNKPEDYHAPLTRIYEEARAALPETEFLLCPPHIDSEEKRAQRANALAFAAAHGIELFDLYQVWQDYIAVLDAAGLGAAYIMRDKCHMNTRGHLLTAHALAAFFTQAASR